MDIYVGNLNFDMDETEVEAAFENFGTVEKVKLIMDKETGRSKGFAFVTMPNSAEAQAALLGLNEKDFKGRKLRVNEARKK